MPDTFTVSLDGAMLRRGFYLYVWEISPTGALGKVLYVGRTGDNSTPNAQSLFNRLGQNLGGLANASMVRNNLEKRGIDPETCHYSMIGFGPIFNEAAEKTMAAHKPLRDKTAAVERQLADDLRAAGYDVMNDVRSKAVLDVPIYEQVRAAFASHFPGL